MAVGAPLSFKREDSLQLPSLGKAGGAVYGGLFIRCQRIPSFLQSFPRIERVRRTREPFRLRSGR